MKKKLYTSAGGGSVGGTTVEWSSEEEQLSFSTAKTIVATRNPAVDSAKMIKTIFTAVAPKPGKKLCYKFFKDMQTG